MYQSFGHGKISISCQSLGTKNICNSYYLLKYWYS